MTEQELYHYGVKGMKWGIRRDIRILANHRANDAKKRIRRDYDLGKIDSDTKKKHIQEIKKTKKQFMSDAERRYEKTKTDAGRDKLDKEYRKMAVTEVPHVNIKRGMATVNQIISAAGVAVAAGTGGVYAGLTAASYGAVSGAIVLAAGAVDTAATAGLAWVRRKILDTTS